MKRLTFEGNFCDIAQCRELPCPYDGMCSQRKVWERLKEYEDTGLSPKGAEKAAEIENGLNSDGYSISRTLELMIADRDGRVVVLPCKVGDTVWVIADPWTDRFLKKPLEAYANGVKMYSHGLYVNVLFDTRKINGSRDYEIGHVGKELFLAREDAEKALEVQRND